MRLPAFFHRSPDPQAELFAEALALFEDGAAVADILARYPAETQEWLRPMLSTGEIIGGAFAGEEASYYFEGSLKAKVLAAASEAVIGGAPPAALPAPPRFGQFGAAVASVGVLAVAGMLGVISFGFITADDSVPGEWNYGFKRVTEQAQVRFASGDARIDVQISQAQERIDEIQTLVARGDLSQGHINSFTDELEDIRQLAEEEPFDTVQQIKVRNLSETAEVVLSEADEELAPAAAEAIDEAQQVAAAVTGGDDADSSVQPVDPTDTETPDPTPDPDPAAASDPEPASDPDPADETPTPGPTPDPSVTVDVDDPVALQPDATPTPNPDGNVSTGVDGEPQPLQTPEPEAEPEATPEPTPEGPTEPEEPDSEAGTEGETE